MKILVIGSEGNMGRRYSAILKWLGHEVVRADIINPLLIQLPLKGNIDRAIIATPTDFHISNFDFFNSEGIDCLIEKPITNDLSLWPSIFHCDARMICNWQFAIDLALPPRSDCLVKGNMKIDYDCYNTGKDGLAWDCIQLIHLAGPKNVELNNSAPLMHCEVRHPEKEKGYLVTSRHIEESYILMIKAWLENPERLWGMEEAFQAHQEVLEYMRLRP